MKKDHDGTAYDYVIVGSGAAGSVLAERLSRDPTVSVALLEAGGSDRSLLHLVPKGVRFAMSNDRFTKSYVTEPYGEGKTDTWHRGQIIGGSTTINGMVWNRGWAPQYDALEEAGNEGLNWDRFLAAFKALEDHEFGESATRGRGGPVRISVARPREPVADTFIETLTKHGAAHLDDVNSAGGQRVGYVLSNIKRGTRVSAARAHLRNALRRRNLTLLTQTEADRITFEGTRATGVEATRQGRPIGVIARREVLVCGGGLESPLLLERSGIGDPAVLDAAGVPVLVASPNVGENMREHRSIMFRLRLKGQVGYNHQVDSTLKQAWAGFKYLFTRTGVISFAGYNVVALYKSLPGETDSDEPDTQGFFTPLSVSGVTAGRPVVDKASGAMFLTYPLYPTSTGSIHITGPGTTDKPCIHTGYLSTDYDRAITIGMVEKAREILATPPFADLIEGLTEPPDFTSNAEILDYALHEGGIGYHTLGTCAIGPGADDVLDSHLRVRGTSRLRVVDASAFPSMPSGNNNAPTQALAWIAADLILREAT